MLLCSSHPFLDLITAVSGEFAFMETLVLTEILLYFIEEYQQRGYLLELAFIISEFLHSFGMI